MAGSIQKYMNASLLQQNNKLLSDKQVIEGNPLFCIQKNPIIRYGFETITKNKVKHWRCTHTIQRNGKNIKCIRVISNTKYESLTEDQQKNLRYHTHTFPGIEQFVNSLATRTDHEPGCELSKLDQITEKLFKLIAEKNLSISTGVSTQMINLITTAIEWGRKHKFDDFSNFIFMKSRPTFTSSFIQFADSLRKQQINSLKIFKFVSLQVDAGKPGSQNYIESTILNPFWAKHPIIHKSLPYFDGKPRITAV